MPIATPIHISPALAPAPLPQSDLNPIVGGRVELQLLTTLKCNLKCSYCSLGVGEVLGSQVHVEYDIDQLSAFVARHLQGKEVYVTFYGGEPTLNKALMLEVMQRFPHFRFQLQTNATLISKLPDETLGRLSNVLASIDGGEATTDAYRGRGIYRQVMKNLRKVRKKVGGSITARVTWGNPYVKQDARYRSNVVEPICELIRFMGREIDQRNPQAWFDQSTLSVRKQLMDCEVYEYVEIMP